MDQKVLAIDIGCDASTVSKFEHDERLPSIEMAVKLERLLHLKPGSFLTEVLAAQLQTEHHVLSVEHIIKTLMARLTLPAEDLTLLQEADWTTLRAVIEPLVSQMLRQRASTVRHANRPTHKTIFVIEDERQQCHILVEMLHQHGYSVDYAFDGREALKRILAKRAVPHLILLDMRLPKMNGRVFLQKLHKLKLHTKVIAVTAYPQDIADLHLDNRQQRQQQGQYWKQERTETHISTLLLTL